MYYINFYSGGEVPITKAPELFEELMNIMQRDFTSKKLEPFEWSPILETACQVVT